MKYLGGEKGSRSVSETTGRHRLPRQRTRGSGTPSWTREGQPSRAERFRLAVGPALRRTAGVAKVAFVDALPVILGSLFGAAVAAALFLLGVIVWLDLM